MWALFLRLLNIDMAKIEIKTRIDITNTNVRHKDQGTEKQLNQNRNYTTFLQVFGLRSVFNIVKEPVKENGFWTMIIDTDRDDVFMADNDPVGFLKQDLDSVPVITGLDEEIKIKQSLIVTSGKTPNTIVQLNDK